MTEIRESQRISGVYLVELNSFSDERGRFLETFRKEWFPQRDWSSIQTNRSDSKRGVLRGLHYHFHQVDYWYVVSGQVRAGLVDIRPDSPTCGDTQLVEMGGEAQIGLFIPIGVAHGFVALTDATLTYIVDNYYDSSDEYGIVWNDPDVGFDWGIDTPLLSERDAANPRLVDIPEQKRPRMQNSQ